jgi:hypothetical protein
MRSEKVRKRRIEWKTERIKTKKGRREAPSLEEDGFRVGLFLIRPPE